jgi:YidC/Oxa1 family membrane protein insertase
MPVRPLIGPRIGLLIGLLLAVVAASARADVIELRGTRAAVTVDTHGGLPRAWLACAQDCLRDEGSRRVFLRPGAGGGTFRWTGPRPLAGALADTDFLVVRAAAGIVELRGTPTGGTGEVTLRYELADLTHELRLTATVPAGAGLALVPAEDLRPEPQPGFGGLYAHVEAVHAGATGAAGWTGIRARFWAWLGRAGGTATANATEDGVAWTLPAGGTLDLRLYAGPVEWRSLRVVDPDLTDLLFAGLWAPLRALAFGLFFLLAGIATIIPAPGPAIIVLSLCVKILLAPLTRVAERWQADVNRVQARLAPRLAAIRRDYRGEEAHRRTLEAYRAEGVSPWFTVRSLGGFAIQVPMFIAAFDMLADNFALSGAGFLWVRDLAAPDRFGALPFAVPFFGAHFNLLPALMTLLTVLSAIVQGDPHLTPDLLRRQRLQLYGMAGAFFLLFYTFPAGMVLYWTANNGWHLVRLLLGRLRPGAAPG